jgi:hypothetical protein
MTPPENNVVRRVGTPRLCVLGCHPDIPASLAEAERWLSIGAQPSSPCVPLSPYIDHELFGTVDPRHLRP